MTPIDIIDMVTHMKTTIDIADSILLEAKRLAAKKGTTLRALVERGLRNVLNESRPEGGFVLRRVTFGGNGLRPEVAEGGWAAVRDTAYQGRGA